MIKPEILLLEKRRYGLEETISEKELEMLKKDVPVQKIIGYIEMANTRIDLSFPILIPRYETEELVLLALELIKEYNLKTVLDLCCGSGFIGIALKKNNHQLEILQTDVDDNAIAQTKKNLEINDCNNEIRKSDLFENIEEKFDLIISNPPYIDWKEKKNMSESVLNHEPHHALFAPEQGLWFYKQILQKATMQINNGGILLFEINPIHVQWFLEQGFKIKQDINKKNRMAYKFF